MSVSADLARLEALRLRFGRDAARRRLELMRRLGRATLRDAEALRRFHEALCFARAYPDNQAVLALATRLLGAFARRADLQRRRDELAGSGIAGTDLHDRLFAAQAQWLARHWPSQLEIDRDACEPGVDARIAQALPSMLDPMALQALVETKAGGFEALDRLRGAAPDASLHARSLAASSPASSRASSRASGDASGDASRDASRDTSLDASRPAPRHASCPTDAVVLLDAIASMPGTTYTRESVSDTIDAAYVLRAGATTPSRTTAALAFAPIVFRDRPPPHARPDLRASLAVAPRRLRRLALAEGRALADAAQAAMVTRSRSLEAFSFANPADAWLVDDGDGLGFALIGVQRERRHPLAAWIGGLCLRNGVPIGYTQADIVGPTASLSFNTFETFRGAESAHAFARWLAALRHLFATTSFSLEPYQLGGKGNDEGLASGAFWFYAKLGFAPRDREALALLARERTRIARNPGHRSTLTTLRRLAASHLHFDLDRPWGLPRLASLGWQAAQRAIAQRHDGRGNLIALEHRRSSDDVTSGMQRRCGVVPSRLNAAEQQAWRNLAPLLALAPWAEWPRESRHALGAIVAAKAARSETGFIRLVAGHEPLMRWLTAAPAHS